MSRTKQLIIIIGVLLVTFAAWHHFKPKKTATKFITATVSRGDVEDTVLAAGTLQARKLVSVGAQTSGEVKRLFVELGDTLKAGNLIAEIDAMTQHNTVKNTQAALGSQIAQKQVQLANLNQAKLNWQRQKTLFEQDAASRQEFENAEAAYQTAQANIQSLNAQIEQAKLAVNTAQINLGRTRITAPISGTVVDIVTEQGQTVNANQTTPTIVQLADLKTLTIEAQISEADVVKVKSGLPVYFTILGEPDIKHYAKLRSIEPAPETIADNSSGSTSAVYYNGLIDVPNADNKLRIDMTTQVYIVLDAKKNILMIPSAAIEHQPKTGKSTVRVLDENDEPQVREVKVGLDNRVDAEILSGLREGERVVVAEDTGESTENAARRGIRF